MLQTGTELFCSSCGMLQSVDGLTASHSGEIPLWETDLRISEPLYAFSKTVLEVLFHPGLFFTKITGNHRHVRAAFCYGLAVGSIGLLSSWIWSLLLTSPTAAAVTFLSGGKNVISSSALIAAPLVLSLQFLLGAFYIRFMLFLGKAKNNSLPDIFRMLCYAQTPMVLQIIPFAGPFLSVILWIHAVLSGTSHLGGISKIKAALLLLLPCVALLSFIVIIIAAGVIGGVISGISQSLQWMDVFDFLR